MTRWLVNPLVLFWAVWVTAIGLYAGGVYAGTLASPRPILWVVVLLSVGGFSLGYLTWSALQSSSPPAAPALSQAKMLTPERIVRGLWLTGSVGLIALALSLYRTAVIASSLGMTVRQLLADPALLRIGFAMFVTAGVQETSWLVMLSSIANALFSIGFVLLGVFLHVDAGRRKYFYLCGFLLLAAVIGLTSVSRYETTVNIVFLVFTYCFVSGLDRRGMTRPRLVRVLLPLAALAVLFFVIDSLLQKSAIYNRADRLTGFLYHLFWYLASPLAALNELLTTFDGRYHLGQYTFFPLYKWLCRLHVAPEADISVFGEFVFVPYVANTYTWLRNFYEDFGLIGVAAVPYILGLAACALRTRAARTFAALNLYMILLAFILFSFYNYFLFSNQVYLQALFAFLLFRYTLPAPDQPASAGRASSRNALALSCERRRQYTCDLNGGRRMYRQELADEG
jgi:oligosaccharide repeat unit polymerase